MTINNLSQRSNIHQSLTANPF